MIYGIQKIPADRLKFVRVQVEFVAFVCPKNIKP